MNFGKLVGLVLLLLSIFLLWQIRFIILLAFTSISLATALNRIVQWLMQWKLSRRSAVIITLLALLGLVLVTVTVIVPPFLEQIDQWLTQVPTESAQIRVWLENINSRVPPVLAEQFQQLNAFIQEIPNIARGLFNNFFRIFSSTLSILINSFLVLAVTIMLIANPKAYRRAFISVFPQFYRHRVQDILDHCEKALVGWGIGICFNMVVISLMSFIGLVIIQVPLPIGNALIAGILTFIPNIGPILSVIPPAVLGVLDSPWKAIAVIGLYTLIQQVESNFLTPLVMKHQVSLLPAVTLVSQLICGVLFGFLGLFLALPLVVTGQVLLQELLVKDIMDNWQKPSSSGNSARKKIVATY